MHFWASALRGERRASSGRLHPFATRQAGGLRVGWAASWHAFHLRSDGCGKRWRWQCVLIARSALLKPSEVGLGWRDWKRASSRREIFFCRAVRYRCDRCSDGFSITSITIHRSTSGPRGLGFRTDGSTRFFFLFLFLSPFFSLTGVFTLRVSSHANA